MVGSLTQRARIAVHLSASGTLYDARAGVWGARTLQECLEPIPVGRVAM